MDKNKVKIELYKSKEIANFSHYVHGNLYYKVRLESGIYQFPIETIEYIEVAETHADLSLSSDLGTTSFYAEMKGSDLNRWISKAIDKNEFTKVE